MNADRLRPVVLALAAGALAVVLTGCQQGGAAAGGAAPSAPATSTAAPGPAGSGGGGTPTAVPTDAPTAAPAVKKPASPKTSEPAPKPKPAAPAPTCVDSTPGPDDVDPDEFALYRIEELDGSTGKVNLVIQHGAWGCGSPDSDGGPFVVTGEESRWALDQAAYVTATNPIVTSAENQRIGVQELIDWVKAHPDSGLVFRYETGDDGAIHRLEEVFTP
ncbi:hypothetical protein [Streptomyces sp. TLI_105]|uniref:hypothetical protein n=1 Tax=Streptomyces sp. TLI_105 TaxID=1881019 RepID=UPI000898D1B8|nr:hypothetical protein [Streptomyces sp. TLI_105]SEC87205.1 hypothetical protein SAMN05428939_3504 [Streptomyces sp. TLI_105]